MSNDELITRYEMDSKWRDAWSALANHPTLRKKKYRLQTQQEYIEHRANLANMRIKKLLPNFGIG
ncbi:hypothetical protein VCHA53O466_50141 [Vibrio chagasii]|nr:hypothetical protein VCHA53O466_50141 [Vibrio chagasii]